MPTHDFQKTSGNPQTLTASIYGGQWSSIEYAAADRQQVAVGPADRQQVAVGPADRQQVEPGTARRRIRELESMVPGFVDRIGGSKCMQAQPVQPTFESGKCTASSNRFARIEVLSGRGLGRRLSQKGGLPAVPRHISLRPSRAFESVTSSAYSRSLPTGTPCAIRVTRIPMGLISRAM